MTISNEERERRRKTLGSSDVPAILGLNPWMSGADVQASKLYPLEEIEDSAAVRIGNVLETALCQWAVGEGRFSAGELCEYSPEPVLHDLLPFSANCDAIVRDKCVIEAKTTSLHDEWGEPGSDEVPPHVVVQVSWQLALTRLEFALVPVLFTGLRRDLQLYRVPRNEELIEELLRQGEDWWIKHVELRQPVPPDPPSLDVLRRIRRQPGTTTVIDPGLVAAKRETGRVLKAARAADDTAKAALIAALGDAEAGTDADGNVLCTFLAHPRREYTVAANTIRTLRIKGGDE